MEKTALNTFDHYLPFLFGGARVLFLLLAGYLLTIVINRAMRVIRAFFTRTMLRDGARLQTEVEKRAATVATVTRRTLLTLLWVAVALMALQELGFKIEALLAGAGISAGIIGVAVGFGAQTLIKDILAGLFLLVENQVRVGDVAVVNGVGGVVEEINLRTIVLRAENGAVHIIPNGLITSLANLTREFSFYVFEFNFRLEEDTERAIEVIRSVASDVRADPVLGPFVLDQLDVMGVDKLKTDGVLVKCRIKTLPTKQWAVGREMNRRILARFNAEKIDLSASPTVVRLEPHPPSDQRDQLKSLIREVLAEIHAAPPDPRNLPGAGARKV
jgi:small-conductance mechanosensitive channel